MLMKALLDKGEAEAALELFVRQVMQMPDHELQVYRQLPMWKGRVALAPTIPREMALDRVLFALGLVDALDLEHGGLLRRSGPQCVQTVALQGLDHGGRRLEDLEGAA